MDYLPAFKQQRKNARTRGIEFKFTFEQWLAIWNASGHLAGRGRGRGLYVMARLNDNGAYAVGNVKIILNEQNSSEGNLGKVSPATQRAAAIVSNKRRVWTRRARAKIGVASKLRAKTHPRGPDGQFANI